MENPACPYCNNHFEKMPGRKKKCPQCGHFVFVRTVPSTRERVLATQKQADEIDLQWHEYSEKLYVSKEPGHYEYWLDAFDIDEKMMKTYKTKLSSQLGREPLHDELMWSILIDLTNRISDLHKLKMVLWKMADMQNFFGGNAYDLLFKAQTCELINYQMEGIEIVKVYADNDYDVCDKCCDLHGKKMMIVDALRKMPLPCKACTDEVVDGQKWFCTCHYRPTD